MGPNDMVFHKEGGQITAGAFKIKSDFFGNPAAKLFTGGKANSNTFLDGLAVPAGLLLLQQIGGTSHYEINNEPDNVVSDNLYDRLFKLVSEKKPERKTRKDKKKHLNRTTRKHK
jgi:hypothetical protein